MSRASEALLDQLHAMLADDIIAELKRARERAELHPDDPQKAISPQLLDKAMKMLAMSGVTAPATSKRAEDVAAKLADLNLDEEILDRLRPN